MIAEELPVDEFYKLIFAMASTLKVIVKLLVRYLVVYFERVL